MICSGRDLSGFGSSAGNSKGHFMLGSGLLPGALGGTRTPNLLIRSQMLYPLSYERTNQQYTAVRMPTVRADGASTRAQRCRASDFLILNGLMSR
jgi:hypothetical protein